MDQAKAHRQLGLPSFSGREDQGELEQAPGPDGQDHDAESLVSVHLLILQGYKEEKVAV